MKNIDALNYKVEFKDNSKAKQVNLLNCFVKDLTKALEELKQNNISSDFSENNLFYLLDTSEMVEVKTFNVLFDLFHNNAHFKLNNEKNLLIIDKIAIDKVKTVIKKYGFIGGYLQAIALTNKIYFKFNKSSALTNFI